MSKEILFYIATAAYYVLPILLPIFILLTFKYPKNHILRTLIAILVPWVFLVLFTAHVLNPAGIAYAISQGIKNPSMKFDNNTISVALLSGWFAPTLIAVSFFIGYVKAKKEIK